VTTEPVTLSDAFADHLRSVAARADHVAGLGDRDKEVGDALGLARELGRVLPLPGEGDTVALWSALATVAAADLTVARVVEPHLDALAILDQAAPGPEMLVPGDATWGVYAAEGGDAPLHATGSAASGWRLTGTKPWCSLADRVSHALVTAWVDDERRGLFAVDLADPGIRPDGSGTTWVSRGLAPVRSLGLQFDEAPAAAVGPPDWYLDRPGFAWGGVGVAAIWYGGAVGLARRLHRAARGRTPDQVALVHLGRVDTALTAARVTLTAVATSADSRACAPADAGRAALRARQVVADAAEVVLSSVGRALGPAPLTLEEDHARRVADLTVYLRQHHAERDLARLGESVLSDSGDVGCWW